MKTEPAQASDIGRRGFFRAGGVMAGMAAATAVGAVIAEPAQAADGDVVKAGQHTTASSTTSLTVGGANGTASPALQLSNANGPSLALQPLPADWAGTLTVGELAGSALGPIVGVDGIEGTASTYLATGVDLANIPTPFSATPSRLLDLRGSTGRSAIIRRSSSAALDSKGRLRAGHWIDIGVVPTDPEYALQAIFANLIVFGPRKGGDAALYPPGVRPLASSLYFSKGKTVANAAFAAVGSVLDYYAVRLYTSADAWFVLDLSGGTSSGTAQAPLAQATALRKSGGRAAVNNRLRTAFARAAR
jgi:hypothetical protein